MSRYSPEQKAASIRRARELLARLDARAPYEPADEDVASADALKAARDAANLVYEPVEDDLSRWKRKANEWTAQCEAATAAREAKERAMMRGQQRANIDRRIAAAIEKHGDELNVTLGQVVSEVRHQLRAEIQTAIGELRGELSAQRSAEKHQRGQILDLPALPWRRRSSDVA